MPSSQSSPKKSGEQRIREKAKRGGKEKHWGVGVGVVSAEASDGRGDSGENVSSKVKRTMTKFISGKKILSSLVTVLNVVVQ